MSNQQFAKNTNAPAPESELWTIADGWKISAKSGKIYTNLDKVYTVDENSEGAETSNALYNALLDQLSGRVKEPIDYVGHYIVAGKSQDGTELVYAFYKNQLQDAEKQVKYSASSGFSGTVPKAQPKPQQQRLGATMPTINRPVEQMKNTTPPLSTVQRTIEVVKDVIPIPWDNAMEIAKAEERGLYVLPVAHVGKENFFFENKDGDRCFLYGRIINVKVGDN